LTDQQSNPTTKKKKRSLWRYLGYLIILFFLLFFLISLLIQLPAVQNKLADWMSHSYSKKLDADIDIGEVYISLVDGVVIKDFIVADPNGDTILVTKRFSTSFNSSLKSMLSNDIDLGWIYLEDAQVNLKTAKGQSKSNLELLLEKLNSKRTEKSTASSTLPTFEGIDITRSSFILQNENDGSYSKYSINKGLIDVDQIDIANRSYAINLIKLDQPIIELRTAPKPDEDKESVERPDDTEQVPTAPFQIFVEQLQITNGQLLKNTVDRKSIERNYFDKDHFKVNDLNIQIEETEIVSDGFVRASLKNISGILNDKVNLEDFRCESFVINKNGIEINDFGLKSNRTVISQQLFISYQSFSDLRDSISNVAINADLEQIDFAVDDLVYFVPGLKKSDFIKNNQGKTIKLKGQLIGNAANLQANNIDIQFGNGSRFKGNISGKNLNIPGREIINLRVATLQSSVPELRAIIPGLTLPDNFDKLGKINYSGSVDGFIEDFVIFGNLTTDIGDAIVDVRLDSKDGFDLLAYSGFLDLIDFDLKTWTGNDDFDKVSFTSQIIEGKGLKLNNASAILESEILSFTFRDYEYKNILIDGAIDKDQFNGALSINDQNISLDFDGFIKGIDSLPQYEFVSHIKYADLQALNLMEEKMQISGDISLDVQGKTLVSMVGTGRLDKFLIVKQDSIYSIDSLLFSSQELRDDEMSFKMNSDIVDVEARGKFDLRKIHTTFIQILKKNYPYHTRQIKLDSDYGDKEYQYTLDVDVKDSKNLLELAGVKNLRVKDTQIKGFVSTANNEFDIDIESPGVTINDIGLMKIKMKAINKDDNGSFVMKIDSSSISSIKFNPMRIATATSGDRILFNVTTEQNSDSLQNISVLGQLIPHEKGYEINIEDNELFVLGKNWAINDGNKIIVGDKYLDLDDVIITDGDRAISLGDINNEGLNIDMINFNMDLLNPILDYDKMLLSGSGNTNVKINTIFGEDQFITGYVSVPDFRVNGDEFGQLLLKAEKKNDVNALDIAFAIAKDTQNMTIMGGYDLSNNELDIKVDIDYFPLNIFEYIIPEGISQTSGNVSIDAKISGPTSDLKLLGDATIRDGASKIDYLGTYYTFDDQYILLDETFIDATELELTDVKGNTAKIEGGLRHQFFKDFKLDLSIKSPRFIGLNTTKRENPLYYGLGEGEMTVDFSGSFDAADIEVTAVTAPTAHLSFPISESVTDFDESFIKFKKKESDKEFTEAKKSFAEEIKLLGLNFKLNLQVTEDALVSIIFDERVGEVLKGRGTGDISVDITRTGDFEVFGEYNVVGGEYLFSAYGLVAKPFIIKRGGVLNWNGDPFNASLRVEAAYTGVRAPLNVFLAEYLSASTEQTQQEARNRTDVDLDLILNGTLFKPIVSFDIGFPEVNGELKSYTDNKMMTLNSTENGINDQVVGLLIFNSFLPYNNPLSTLSGNSLIATGSSTVTEFITSQLGLVINDVISKGLQDNSFIKGIDVNIGLNENTDIFSQNSDNNILPDELDVSAKTYFKNDNFVLNLGGNYVWEPTFGVESYILGDVILDYFITDDRKLKLQIYSKFDYDETEGYGRRYQNGFGITYRSEFGSLSDFVNELDENVNQGNREPGGSR